MYMEWLNYHHLLYFWTVAREGSVAQSLRAAPAGAADHQRADPGSSRRAWGEKLFARSGRGLALTETGQVVYRYADEIFSLGRELTSVLEGRRGAARRAAGRAIRFRPQADRLPHPGAGAGTCRTGADRLP